MSFIPKPNSGTLFLNNRKEMDSHPDMTGNIFLDRGLLQEIMGSTPSGELVKISVSACNNDSRIGLRFSKPYVAQQDQKSKTAEAPRVSEVIDDGDVPF